MVRRWNKDTVVQDVGQKQEKESRGGEHFKSTGEIKAGGGKNKRLRKVTGATLGTPVRTTLGLRY